jgi:hypothetical protein
MMMIVPISGNVKYQITLDASVWIFDERKIKFEDAFKADQELLMEKETIFSSAERYNREVFQTTNNNPPISRADGTEILKHSYVMPFEHFYHKVEVASDATDATLVQTDGSEVIITIDQLKDSFLRFARNGKPLIEDGPVHIYFRAASNKDEPIKHVKRIIIN